MPSLHATPSLGDPNSGSRALPSAPLGPRREGASRQRRHIGAGPLRSLVRSMRAPGPLLAAAVLALCLVGRHGAGALALAAPVCPPVFVSIPTESGGQRSAFLPMCALAPPAAGAAAAVPAAAASSVYPCTVGDAACYCQWRGRLGYFADNDPAVDCT